MQNRNAIDLNYTSDEELLRQISEARDHLESLKIYIRDNANTWVVYPRTPKAQQMPSFTIKRPIDRLPALGELPKLKSLDISFLGLKSLPDDLNQYATLEELNISFNSFKFSDVLNNLMMLKGLKTIKAYGIMTNQDEVRLLIQKNPELKVYYTQAQFLAEVEELKRMKN
ncbi:hypothetical protein [Fulvivirga ligni]|uniref:hypothetical protein n=1 Tax=Fulvivirga ligni TaxID=2904246 RepID=UPI001F25266E|nr:hypothetical protein [Fulvivirga ligni]UII22535.1 hypothetical protein LVD16_04750 [Fulvivirga ligni]